MSFNLKSWACEFCTFENAKNLYCCEMCGGNSSKYNYDIPDHLLEKEHNYETNQKTKFDEVFGKDSHVIICVVHVETIEQTMKEVDICFSTNIGGIMLINHNISYNEMIPIVIEVRNKYPQKWIGINFMDVYAFDVFECIKKYNLYVNGVWCDKSYINDGMSIEQHIPRYINYCRFKYGWDGIYFGSVLFKHQQQTNLPETIKNCAIFSDTITTSGTETGTAIEMEKLVGIYNNSQGVPIVLASGVSEQNICELKKYSRCSFVNSSISTNGTIDKSKLENLLKMIE